MKRTDEFAKDLCRELNLHRNSTEWKCGGPEGIEAGHESVDATGYRGKKKLSVLVEVELRRDAPNVHGDRWSAGLRTATLGTVAGGKSHDRQLPMTASRISKFGPLSKHNPSSNRSRALQPALYPLQNPLHSRVEPGLSLKEKEI
jgi:hypothetical protein